ncbi:unnamed protein product, partial [Amoebophrya sp. A120]
GRGSSPRLQGYNRAPAGSGLFSKNPGPRHSNVSSSSSSSSLQSLSDDDESQTKAHHLCTTQLEDLLEMTEA